jgi:uncharacterized protein YacL
MVVVTDAVPFVGTTVEVKLGHEVSTSRGRMLFATVAESAAAAPASVEPARTG